MIPKVAHGPSVAFRESHFRMWPAIRGFFGSQRTATLPADQNRREAPFISMSAAETHGHTSFPLAMAGEGETVRIVSFRAGKGLEQRLKIMVLPVEPRSSW